MTPAEVGTLLEDKIDPRDITSTLIDLAVRGYVKIEETLDRGLAHLRAGLCQVASGEWTKERQ